MKKHTLRFLLCLTILIPGMTACSSPTPAPPLLEPAPEFAAQPQAGNHLPVILRVVERQETRNGFLVICQDIHFNDLDGDADSLSLEVTSSSLSYSMDISGGGIEVPAEEQKVGSILPICWTCNQKINIVLKSQISDRLSNVSEAVNLPFSCTTPLAVDTRSFLISGLSMLIPIALVLALVFWLLFRKCPTERLPALRSTLLLFCLLLLLRFMYLVLHEGGHALYLVARGIPFTLYVHPFAIAGYSRPIIDNSIWKDISGSATALLFSLLISLSFSKRRSLAILPLVMLFPYVALNDGFNVLGLMGDFQNLVQTNGLSPVPFYCLGSLILGIGIIFFLALLPLIGLDPKDKRALFVFPAAMFLVNALSFLVAYIFVPGSTFDRKFFAGQEILMTGISTSIINMIFGLIIAVLYLTLFNKIYFRLPAWMRMGTVRLAWKDLRIPSVLAVISVILGILIIV